MAEVETQPENCPGPGSELSGKSDACQGCPSREVCKTTPKVDPGKFCFMDLMISIYIS